MHTQRQQREWAQKTGVGTHTGRPQPQKGNGGSTQGRQGSTQGHDQRGQVPTQIKKKKRTDFPGGPWLRLQAPNAGATGAKVRPPVGETKIPRAKKRDPMAPKKEKKREEKR